MAVVFGLHAQVSSDLDIDKYMVGVGGNSGNLAFHHAINLLCAGITGVINWHNGDQLGDLDSSEIVLLPCANQVGSHMDMRDMAELFHSHLHCSLIAIGLGVQHNNRNTVPEVPEGTRMWIKAIGNAALFQKSPNILARGSYSASVINDIAKFEVAKPFGCPSILINPDPGLGITIRKNIPEIDANYRRVAVLAGHNLWGDLTHVENKIVEFARKSDEHAYILQSGEDLFHLKHGLLTGIDIALVKKYCAGTDETDDEFLGWVNNRWKLFYDIPSWMEFYKGFDVALGTRIHGCVIALQAGIPACCLVHDSRTKELCEILRVPFVDLSEALPFDINQALDAIRCHNWDDFDVNRKQMARHLSSFLSGNGLTASAHLKAMCE